MAKSGSVATAGRRTWGAALVVALGATVVAGAWSWVPSAWADEAATVSAATRGLGQLRSLVADHDLVHAAYYVGMHVWFATVGVHDWTLRLPSAIAVGVTVLGTVVLGARLRTLRTGVLAGVLVCLIPQSLWAATEARSYAWTMALAVWLALVFVVAAEGRARWWVVFGVLAALSVVVFLYLALVVVALAVTVATVPRWRPSWWRFALAGAAAGLVTTPLVLRAVTQRSQVDWVPPLSTGTLRSVAGGQWFTGNVSFRLETPVKAGLLLVFWALVVAAVALAARRPRASGADEPDLMDLVGLALPWLVVPTGLLVVASFARPVYLERYVTSSVPAIALLAAATLAHLRRGRLVAALVVLAALVAPVYVAQREVWAKGTDWSVVAAQLETSARPGDAVYFLDLGTDEGQWFGNRAILTLYPGATRELDDVALGRAAADAGELVDDVAPLGTVADRLATHDRLWVVVGPSGADWESSDAGAAFTRLGFAASEVTPGRFADVVLLTR